MINELDLEIEACAIEQPIYLSIPESKMILAVYLAEPEVENDRRSLNITDGMRKVRKEGRFIGVAPYGYANKITEDHRKYIAPTHPEADVIIWILNEFAKERANTQQAYVLASRNDLFSKKAKASIGDHQ
ncbi:serine integrase family protein [Chitinophaga rhizophila]|uniref:Uncharacterized protein n=1 Tax=Chitinophaga rhizophila TaxID=2866212 RepID=A0ABS7G9B2_9BACT|nr:hypothetical protein [Chitinophaga rhizophila]MBW8683895.1 hypothetical protein [Chitinophaga rhizophila]